MESAEQTKLIVFLLLVAFGAYSCSRTRFPERSDLAASVHRTGAGAVLAGSFGAGTGGRVERCDAAGRGHADSRAVFGRQPCAVRAAASQLVHPGAHAADRDAADRC